MVWTAGGVTNVNTGNVEELESQWPTLQRSVCGLAQAPYAADLGLRTNPSRHAHYSTYYDEPTRRILDAYMGADLRAFGYRFERA